jgi:hypothetical protein
MPLLNAPSWFLTSMSSKGKTDKYDDGVQSWKKLLEWYVGKEEFRMGVPNYRIYIAVNYYNVISRTTFITD